MNVENENAIEVINVKKSFKVFYDKGHSLKEKVLFRRRNQFETRSVLNDISFEAKRGEAIGLIGSNGCGKSTTLKLLTKIMYPDEGSIVMNGRVSSLIELGAGFHPDMSGRENIYTNASIFGLTRKEIDSRMKKIIEFSELEEFLDNPVRTYSSGMYMRLAFSVAISVDADILLIDEILAVGDANFQSKCFNKLREIKANGTTIVIVSHSLGQIELICDKSIWINYGKIVAEGIPRDVHPQYLDFMGNKKIEYDEINRENNVDEKGTSESKVQDAVVEQSEVENMDFNSKRFGNKKVIIKDVKTVDAKNINRKIFKTGEQCEIKIEYFCEKLYEHAVIGVAFIRNDGIYCYGTNTEIDKVEMEFDLYRSGRISFLIKEMNLLPGVYNLDVAIGDRYDIPADYIREVLQIEMFHDKGELGTTHIEHEWKYEEVM